MAHEPTVAKSPLSLTTALVIGGIFAVLTVVGFITYADSAPPADRTDAKTDVPSTERGEEKLSPYERANRSPPLYLDLEPGKTEAHAEIELTPYEWSREIVTAIGTSWRYDVRPPNGCLVWFRSEESPREYTTETPVQNFGVWRGIFRLKGIESEPQKATITIVKNQ